MVTADNAVATPFLLKIKLPIGLISLISPIGPIGPRNPRSLTPLASPKPENTSPYGRLHIDNYRKNYIK